MKVEKVKSSSYISGQLLKIAESIIASPRYKVGDHVKFRGKRRVYEVTGVTPYGTYDLSAISGGNRGSRPTSVDESDIEPAEGKEETLDKKGRSAEEAFLKEYGKEGDWVVLDFSRTTSESMGKVKKITPKGRVKVEEHFGSKSEGDMESFKPAINRKGDTVMFTPHLHRGQWRWYNGRETQYIKKKYNGGNLTVLLD